MRVPNNVRVRVLLIQGTLGREGRRYLSKYARKAFQYLEKSKLVYMSKVCRKHYSGFPKFLIQKKGAVAAERLEAPRLVRRHLIFANLLGLEDQVRFAQAEAGDPCWISPAPHLAYLMDPAL
jgi:hypothetical protein